MNIRPRYTISSIILFVLMLILLYSCSKHPNHPDPIENGDIQQTETAPEHNQVDSAMPDQSAVQPNSSMNQPEQDQPKPNDAHISSTTEQDNNQPTETNETNQTESNTSTDEQNEDVKVPYNKNNPTLMGLSIHQSKDEIKLRYGEPLLTYIMDDPLDPITVYEYPGFLVGYNHLNLIAFVDVTASNLDPGLNGLKLGDSMNKAIEALGEPDQRTEFVMNYRSHTAMLKLDINPATNTISSIKLFGVE